MKLGERKCRILATVIEEYLATSKPVGSGLVSNIFGGKISSATVRNEMARLFELGLLEQPHTSAGRIPSLNGYRLYAANIMAPEELDPASKAEISGLLESSHGVNSILKRSCALLAEKSGCVAVFSTIHLESDMVEQIKLAPAGSTLCVVTVSTFHGTTQRKVCNLGCAISLSFLDGLTVFLNNSFCNKSLKDVTRSFVNSLIATSGFIGSGFTLNSMLVPILLSIYDICHKLELVELFVRGTANLLKYPELSQNAGHLLAFLEEQLEVEALMTADPGRIEIKVGQNIAGSELKPFSIIDACYEVKGKGEGRIALIGPVRLDYRLCVAYLKYFLEVLPSLLG